MPHCSLSPSGVCVKAMPLHAGPRSRHFASHRDAEERQNLTALYRWPQILHQLPRQYPWPTFVNTPTLYPTVNMPGGAPKFALASKQKHFFGLYGCGSPPKASFEHSISFATIELCARPVVFCTIFHVSVALTCHVAMSLDTFLPAQIHLVRQLADVNGRSGSRRCGRCGRCHRCGGRGGCGRAWCCTFGASCRSSNITRAPSTIWQPWSRNGEQARPR